MIKRSPIKFYLNLVGYKVVFFLAGGILLEGFIWT